jgi:hypothetical protein
VRRRRETCFLRRVVVFSLLSGCFTSLVSLAVTAALGLSGLVALPPVGDMLRLLPLIFAVSCVLVMVGIIFYELWLRS